MVTGTGQCHCCPWLQADLELLVLPFLHFFHDLPEVQLVQEVLADLAGHSNLSDPLNLQEHIN